MSPHKSPQLSWRIALLGLLAASFLSPALASEVEVPTTADTAQESAEQLIERVVQQRALKVLLAEQLEVARLRHQLRQAEEDDISPPAARQRADIPTAQIVAFWEDSSGKAISISVSAPGQPDRRLLQLREGDHFYLGTGLGGGQAIIHSISRDGAVVRMKDSGHETFLPR